MGKPPHAICLKHRCPSGVNILLMAASVCSIFIIAHTSSAHALYYQRGKPRGVLFPTSRPCANGDCWQLQQPLRAGRSPWRREAMHIPSRRVLPRRWAKAQAIPSGQSRAGHWPCQDELCNLPLRGFSISSCSAFTIHSLPTAGQKPLQH